MRFATTFSAAAFALASFVRASNVVDLTTDNFEKYVGGEKPALVEFYAPWCGHCKNLAPTYEQLAAAFPADKVLIAKTDADGDGRPLGERYGVTGFPTIKWFPAGSLEAQDYTGGRDLESLVSFVTKEAGVKSSIKPPPPPAAVQLDASNFDDIALDDNKNVLVAFTAPWCGHCKNMKPAFEKVAHAFRSESDCVVANMNADDEQNKPVAHRYDVRSFPTIKFFPKGGKEPIMYTEGRDEESFAAFLNEQCGTYRSATGLLNDLAGKVLPLDSLAYEFFTAGLPDRPAVLNKAREALTSVQGAGGKLNSTASYYVKAMERIVEKGESWLAKEQVRIAGLLGSPSLAPTKLDELKIKANILSSFITKRAEELYDQAAHLAEEGQITVGNAAQMVQKAGEDVVEGVKEKVQEATQRVKAEL